MTVTSGTYRPASAHQPRGGRPWCAKCHTDKHLVGGSITVLDAREQTLAVEVNCTRCGDSRVLETTKVLGAALAARSQPCEDRAGAYPSPVHCREPMSLVDPAVRDFSFSGMEDQPPGPLQPRVLRCRCGFQMDAPGTLPGLSHFDQLKKAQRK